MEILCPILLVLVGLIVSQVDMLGGSEPQKMDIGSIGNQIILYGKAASGINLNQYHFNNMENITCQDVAELTDSDNKVNIESIIKKQKANNDEENIILGRNKVLFQKNISEFNNLTNNNIQINDNEKSEIKNNKSEKANNSQKKIDIPTQKEKNEEKNNNNKNNELVPIELIPKLTKEGYKCIPSILELSRMTKEELKKVEGFKIYNQYGEVEFKEPVNLLGLDLDKLVEINKNMIDTADELDYYSKFRLFNIKVEDSELNKYKLNIQRAGGNFIEYKNNEMIWEYKKES